jgi:hypothetical protein
VADLMELADIHVGDEVEYFIAGGWCMRDGKSISRERARAKVVSVYPDPKYGEYSLGVRHDDDEYPGEGLLRLSEITRVIPMISLTKPLTRHHSR